MARNEKTFPIMVVLLSTLFVISTSLSKDDPEFIDYPQSNAPDVNLDDIPPEPSTSVEVPDPVLPPEPSKGYYKFLEECSKHITSKCGAEIYTSLVDNEKISYECCVGLIQMGHTCHVGLAKLIMDFPEVKPIRSQILSRADKAWNDCLWRTTKGSFPPSS